MYTQLSTNALMNTCFDLFCHESSCAFGVLVGCFESNSPEELFEHTCSIASTSGKALWAGEDKDV